jgi:DNA segregation ATPase FtsK/SpoIIIE-like protein
MVISLKKIDRFEKIRYIIQIALACAGIFSAFFFFISLISFNCQDPSWFFKTTSVVSYHNWFGAWGAQSAALLLYIFGGFASLFFVGFLLFMSYFLVQGNIEWDRILAFIFTIQIVATASYLYNSDIISVYVPGGLCGIFFNQILEYFFDPSLVSLFLVVGSISSIIIISRLSCITLGRGTISVFRFIISQERFLKPLMCVIYRVGDILLFFPRFVIARIYSLFDGSEITKLGDSILTLEFDELDEVDCDDDTFWHKFSDSPQQEIAPACETLQEKDGNLQAEIKPALVQKTSYDADEKNNKKIYQLPSLAWFKTESSQHGEPEEDHKMMATVLEEKLERFGVRGRVTSIKVGPVITLFEYQPEIDSKISKIIALEDDLALALQALSIRIIAPIPGRSVVGFEVSNKQRRNVYLGDVLKSSDFKNFVGNLPLVLGQDSIGTTVIVDLAVMPHLLVAGSTGSGKSVALNTMLVSLLCKNSPDVLKLILIDPKRLEFASYADIPHLLVPIVTDPRKAALVLKWVVKTMEERYATMEACNVRNIFDYHELARADNQKPPMPFIVIMIDELSDLMMTAPKETEDLIARITQMARAAGIHMVVATQRPSVDVITGLIKVNFPSRISFRVTSKIDSRTILDCNGADKLLGKGDMLFLDSSSRLKRAHAAFVSDKEIEKLVNHIRNQQQVHYIDPAADFVTHVQDDNDVDDQLYHDVLRFIESVDEVSISLLQRKFRIGYNRSARIIDKLESQGIIMQEPGGKTRKVIR